MIDPSFWLVVIVIITAFLKKGYWKKRATILAVVLFIFFSNKVILNKFINAWQPSPVMLNKPYNAGVVLGGFSSFDKTGNGFLNSSSDRFISTANLYHQNLIKKIIVSGGDGSIEQDRPKEAVFATQKFIENGIAANDIFSETRSRNTFENAVFSKRILDSLQVPPPYVLITSALHMRRAKAVFDKAGVDVVGFPCDYQTLNVKFYFWDYIFPNIETLFKWRLFLKEVAGFEVYKLTGKA